MNDPMRQKYRELSGVEKRQMEELKEKGLELWRLIRSLGESRELSLALTRTEEAVMWAVKHVTGPKHEDPAG